LIEGQVARARDRNEHRKEDQTMPINFNTSSTSGASDPDRDDSQGVGKPDTPPADAPRPNQSFSGPGGTAPPKRAKGAAGGGTERARTDVDRASFDARFRAASVPVQAVADGQLASNMVVRLVDIRDDPELFHQAMEQLPIDVLKWMPAMQNQSVQQICDQWLADSAAGNRRAAVVMPAKGSALPEGMTLGIISLDKRKLVAHPEYSKVMPAKAYPGKTTAGERPLEELVAAGHVWESATYLNPVQKDHYPGGLVNQVSKLIINDWVMQEEGANTGKRPSIYSAVDSGAPEIAPSPGDPGQRRRDANERSLSAMERLAGPPVAMLQVPSPRAHETRRYLSIFELTPDKMLGGGPDDAGAELSVRQTTEARIISELSKSPESDPPGLPDDELEGSTEKELADSTEREPVDSPEGESAAPPKTAWIGAISTEEEEAMDASYEALKREMNPE
jgi:hypothetical protein